jgi:hypothetical protein
MIGGSKLFLMFVIAGLTASCRSSEEPGRIEIETVDVQAEIDAALTTAYDETAIIHGDTVAGVLPGDFPGDIPLYVPASLIEMGSSESGRRFVVFATPDRRDQVHRGVIDKLINAGWNELTADPNGVTTFGRGARRVWIRVQAADALTEIVIEYQPGG